MKRKSLLLIGAVTVLVLITISSLILEVRKARQEAFKARELTLESKNYEVQLMNITMYAPLSYDAVTGHDYSGDPSLTASEEKVVPGETAAAGPNIPFGTEIYVEGLGWHIVQDRGRQIGPNDIDLAVETGDEAREFGKQQRLVIFKNPAEDSPAGIR